ncbi:tetratricopeptide repeat protein [Moraxella oblonga]|uniref:tetratricopeptide repeat protein n=1 Tax=Moraxella oblonga TaxID=200413 RepID=UPI00082DA060|nr:tetratricopeptide repeat protein [Moraxella oblonga]
MSQSLNFVWFEFDKEVQTLWQSLSSPATDKPKFAYESRLRALFTEQGLITKSGIDTTLDSLKTLDVFLSAVKSDLARRDAQESQLLHHEQFIKLLVMVAFHTHQVLKNVLADTLTFHQIQCYTNKTFGRIYAKYFAQMETAPLDNDGYDDFYCGLAFLASGLNLAGQKVAQPLFILNIIGARIFGSIDRQFFALQTDGNTATTPSEDSLYWAVTDFLDNFVRINDERAKALFEQPQSTPASPPQPTPKPTPVAPIPPTQPQVQATKTHTSTPKPTIPPSATPPLSVRKQKARASHTPKLFDEIHQDLVNLPMPSDHDQQYQQAMSVLRKFDDFINKELEQGKTLSDIQFNEKQTQTRTQALKILVELVKQNNPTAMIRLALYYFEGRGVGVDNNKAISLIKRSANLNDIRAQKLLSRLYYQGYQPDNGGVAMQTEMGELWLKKSADNGHPEAKKICAYMNQVELLKEDYRAEVISDQRYIKWGVVFLVLIIIILIIFSIFS